MNHSMTGIEKLQRDKARLAEQELWNYGLNRPSNLVEAYVHTTPADPYEDQGNPCGYGEHLWNQFINEDAPINSEIRQSHNEWVSNRRAWSGVSKYLQSDIETVLDWRGIRTPEPVPQNCNRAELTEYGPADLYEWITETRKRTGNPVDTPKEMGGCFRESTEGVGVGCAPVGFSLYGF